MDSVIIDYFFNFLFKQFKIKNILKLFKKKIKKKLFKIKLKK